MLAIKKHKHAWILARRSGTCAARRMDTWACVSLENNSAVDRLNLFGEIAAWQMGCVPKRSQPNHATCLLPNSTSSAPVFTS